MVCLEYQRSNSKKLLSECVDFSLPHCTPTNKEILEEINEYLEMLPTFSCLFLVELLQREKNFGDQLKASQDRGDTYELWLRIVTVLLCVSILINIGYIVCFLVQKYLKKKNVGEFILSIIIEVIEPRL